MFSSLIEKVVDMGVEQCFYLQWHEHKGSLISAFEKHFERNDFVDCTLAAEGQYLNVHKLILTACSPYFETLLNQSNDKHPIIILKDVKFRELKAIVEYMYRGETNITSTAIKEFFSAAENLQIKGLEKHGKGDQEKTTEARKEFVDAALPASSSAEFLRSFGDPWHYSGRSSLSESTGDSATFNNTTTHSQDTEKNAGLVVSSFNNRNLQHIAITGTGEGDAEVAWPKCETLIQNKSETNVLPSGITNITLHSNEPVLQECLEKKHNVGMFPIPSQNDPMFTVDGVEDAAVKAEQEVPLEEAETESVISSVVELSDTTEEWAEMEEEQSAGPSQNVVQPAQLQIKERSHPYEGTSKVARPSGSTQEYSTETELGTSTSMLTTLESKSSRAVTSSSSSSSSLKSVNTFRASTTTINLRTKSSEICRPYEIPEISSQEAILKVDNSPGFCSAPHSHKRQNLCRREKEFQSASHLKIQMWTRSKEIPFRCLICDYSTPHLDDLKAHQRTHIGDRPYKCQQCETAFTPTCCLQRHQWRYAGERLVKCQFCGFVSGDCGSLEGHKCTRTAVRAYRRDETKEDIQVQENLNLKQPESAVMYYKCEVCDACFRSSFKLVKHRRVHVGDYLPEER